LRQKKNINTFQKKKKVINE